MWELAELGFLLGLYLAIDYARFGDFGFGISLPATAHLGRTRRMLVLALVSTSVLILVYVHAAHLWAGVVQVPGPLPARILRSVGNVAGMVAVFILLGNDNGRQADPPSVSEHAE